VGFCVVKGGGFRTREFVQFRLKILFHFDISRSQNQASLCLLEKTALWQFFSSAIRRARQFLIEAPPLKVGFCVFKGGGF